MSCHVPIHGWRSCLRSDVGADGTPVSSRCKEANLTSFGSVLDTSFPRASHAYKAQNRSPSGETSIEHHDLDMQVNLVTVDTITRAATSIIKGSSLEVEIRAPQILLVIFLHERLAQFLVEGVQCTHASSMSMASHPPRLLVCSLSPLPPITPQGDAYHSLRRGLDPSHALHQCKHEYAYMLSSRTCT